MGDRNACPNIRRVLDVYTCMLIVIVEPSGIPQALVMESSTASSIAISWGRVECLQRNSEITGYVVTLGRSTGDNRMTRQVLEDEMTVNIAGTDIESRRFNATGLQPRSNYTFSVMAVNREGQQGPLAYVLASTGVPTGNANTYE